VVVPGTTGATQSAASQTQRYFTINGISSFKGQNWRLLARVTKKASKKKFKKQTGEGGQLFSVELLDREGTETRATFFGAAVEKFFDVLQDGQTFVFSGGRVKPADKRYCQYDMELTFDERANIQATPDDGQVKRMAFNFLERLELLTEKEEGASVDVAAVVAEVEQPVEFLRKKDNTPCLRQNITLLDDSNTSCNLTLWGETCVPECPLGSVVLVKGVAVSSFSGKSLSSKPSSCFLFGEEAEGVDARAVELSRWYEERGVDALSIARPISERRSAGPPQTIDEIKVEALDLEGPGAEVREGEGGRSIQNFHTLSPVTVTKIAHEKPPFYLACPEEVPDDKREGQKRLCNKKMEAHPGNENMWMCAAGHHHEAPSVRWVCQFIVSDHTGSQYVSGFDDAGQTLLGCKAEEAARRWERRESDDRVQTELEHIFKEGMYKRFRLRVRSRKEFWNDEERLKVSVLEMSQLNLVQDGRAKLAEVRQSLAAMPSE